MQISRHWRLNSQRYRLEGFRYRNGEVSFQNKAANNMEAIGNQFSVKKELEKSSEQAIFPRRSKEG